MPSGESVPNRPAQPGFETLAIHAGQEPDPLTGAVEVAAPVHILQGRADETVPWRHNALLVERLTGGDITLDLIANGDHRLSTPADLDRLVEAVERNRHATPTLS